MAVLLGRYLYPWEMSDDGEIDWNGPSSGTKWIGPIENHLRGGGFAEFRDASGLAARVAGEAGSLPHRTGEAAVASKVFLHP